MTKIIRTLGWIALLGGAVRAAMTPCALYWGAGSVQELSAGVIGSILLTIGTFGIYLHQAKAMGRYGMPVFYLVTFGNILTALLVSLSLNDVLHGRGADTAPVFPFDLVILLNMLRSRALPPGPTSLSRSGRKTGFGYGCIMRGPSLDAASCLKSSIICRLCVRRCSHLCFPFFRACRCAGFAVWNKIWAIPLCSC